MENAVGKSTGLCYIENRFYHNPADFPKPTPLDEMAKQRITYQEVFDQKFEEWKRMLPGEVHPYLELGCLKTPLLGQICCPVFGPRKYRS